VLDGEVEPQFHRRRALLPIAMILVLVAKKPM